MGLAPNPGFPERQGTVYEEKIGPNAPGGRGPLRFEEGVATDTDVPDDFQAGMADGFTSAPGRPNHNNPGVQYKPADQVLRERAHVGSASWVEAPTYLGEFAHGSFSDYAEVSYEQVDRGAGPGGVLGRRFMRENPANVAD